MNKKIESLKNEYETLNASAKLKRSVLYSVKRKRRMVVFKHCAAAAAVFIVVFAVAVNSIPNLAFAMSDVPVLKEVVNVLTLGRYKANESSMAGDNTNNSENEAFYPQVEVYGGELLKGYINQSLKRVTDMYTKNPEYTNVKIDYTVTRNDEEILSVLFTGTADMKTTGKNINIMDSVNIDIAKSTNEITYNNLIKDTPEAREAVWNILDSAARKKGIKGGLEAEGIRIYFKDDDIVFYYMPLDDSAEEFVELSIPESEIKEYLNTDFGDRPAS